MLFKIRKFLGSWWIVFVLILIGCSIQVNSQTGEAPASPVPNTPVLSATSTFPTTQIPMSWAGLDLKGKLIYTSSNTDSEPPTTNIQLLDLATGEVATIFSSSGGWIFYTTVSPDEKNLAFSYSPPKQSNDSSLRSLYLLSLDIPGQPQQLFAPATPDDHYIQVEWSPDGKYIYFVHYNHNNSSGTLYEDYELFRMAYPNGTPEKILDRAFWPRLSPDATKLVYVTLDPSTGLNELYTANSDGSNSRKVHFSSSWIPDIIDAPIFLSDEQSILFSAPGPAQSYSPNWLEKVMGLQIAKAHSVPSDWWSVPVAGGAPVRLTHLQTINLFAAISPDKKYVASVGGEGIFVMDMDGSNLTRLVSDPGVHGTISWLP